VNIHPDVDIRNQETSAVFFQFLTLIESVDTPEDDSTAAEQHIVSLPAILNGDYCGASVNGLNDAFRNEDFRCLFIDITLRRANEPIEIGVFDVVRIEDAEGANAHVRALLHDVRPALF
jgi:hypothetical protein